MKSFYILLAGLSIFLWSCSSSYRSVQTTDDVYYSPAVTNDNGYARSDDGGDYVTVNEDENSYGYRNDVQEEWYIRRGIRNPLFRNSFTMNLGYGGFYNPYDPWNPFLAPFQPISYYGYVGLWDPYYYSHSWLTYTNYFSPYGYKYYPNHLLYSPYNVPPWINPYPYGLVKDNGPRVLNLNRPRTGVGVTPRINNNPNRPTLAPIRTMRNNNNQNGTIERRVTPRTNSDNRNENRNIRRFNKNPRSNDYRTPAPTQNRRYTPPRNNDVSPTPNRTFERPSTPSVDRTPSTPPPSNNSGNKSAPVRKF